MERMSKIGYAWVFENIVVYGNPLELGTRIKSQLGEFIGVIKGVIPTDPYFVLYERLKHTRSWRKRHPQRQLTEWTKEAKP
jgi:hypothetical protein